MTYFLLLVNVTLMSAGQLCFKQSSIFVNAHQSYNILQKFLFNPWFFVAIFLLGISTFTWVQILTSMKISVAYPILSISYVLTAIGAYYIFGEKIGVLNILGILLIMAGVGLISTR